MRVLVIAQYFPPDMGGGATRAYNVVKGLVLNGCEVTVVAAHPHYPTGNIPKKYRWKPLVLERSEGFKIIRTFVPPISSKGLIRRLILFLSFVISSLLALPFIKEVDIIWAANPNVIVTFPAIFYRIIKRRPVVLNVDDLWPEDVCSFGMVKESSVSFKIMSLFTKIAYSSVDALTPISPGYVKVLYGKYGIDPNKMYVVRAGVDLAFFKGEEGEDSESTSSDKAFRILYIGAFSPAYDFDQVLLAAKTLENVDDVKFVLQGGGETLSYVKSRVRELKLKNVEVIDKIISRDKVAKLLCRADALILPLRDFGKPYLGISSKIYEYQAAGKPIICCAEGQPAEYIKKTKSGVVVNPGDWRSIAKAILYLKNNPKIAKEFGNSGKKYVESYLSIRSIGMQMVQIFEEITSKYITYNKNSNQNRRSMG